MSTPISVAMPIQLRVLHAHVRALEGLKLLVHTDFVTRYAGDTRLLHIG